MGKTLRVLVGKTLRVLVVPVTGAIVTKDIADTLEAMQALVGGYIEGVTIATRRDGGLTILYVNEDGIGLGLPVNSRLSEAFGMPLLEQPLHGAGFVSVSSSNGDAVSMSDAEIEAWSRMIFLLGNERLRLAPGGVS